MSDPTTDLNEFINIHDQIKVLLYDQNNPTDHVNFDSRIINVNENKLLIEIPFSVNVSRFTPDNSFMAVWFGQVPETTIQVRVNVIKYVGHNRCWIQVPTDFRSEVLNRRRHVRVNLLVPVKAIIGADGLNPSTLQGETINLSGGGMRFLAKRPLQPETPLVLEFKPDAKSQLLQVQGKVVQCVDSTPEGETLPSRREYHIAVQFLNTSQNQEDMLVGACFRVQLERERHLY